LKNHTIKIQAPGRVCLFGDHQDYLGLPVIACAIDRHFLLSATPIKEKSLRILMPDINKERTILLDDVQTRNVKGDHLMAGLKVMSNKGCTFTKGYEIEFRSEVPINAGVSSSSAMMVAWIYFLWNAFGNDRAIDAETIGQWAYEAEVVEQNSPGGKMDQYTIALGSLIQIDTGEAFGYQLLGRSLDGMVLGESGMPKETLGVLGYLRRKAIQAITAAKDADASFDLETADMHDLKKIGNLLPVDLLPYFEAAIGNHLITKSALNILQSDVIDYPKLGKLMTDHHSILRDRLKITTPLIDAMIAAALDAGAYGAKIVGSGGGGSIVALAPLDVQEAVVTAILNTGAKDAYPINVTTGTKEIHGT